MIYVSCLADMPAHVRSLRPGWLLSLTDPGSLPATPAGLAAGRHLAIGLHDIPAPLEGCIHCEPEHMQKIIAFAKGWEPDEAPLLVHCFAGISRSMAAALVTKVVKAGGREVEAAAALRRAAPHAQPNRRMVAVADDLLGLGGRLLRARDAMGEAALVERGPLVKLALLR